MDFQLYFANKFDLNLADVSRAEPSFWPFTANELLECVEINISVFISSHSFGFFYFFKLEMQNVKDT